MRVRNRCIRPRNLNGATNSGGNSTLLLLKTSPSVIKIMTNRRFHRRPLLVQSALLLPLSGGNATPPDCVQALQLVELTFTWRQAVPARTACHEGLSQALLQVRMNGHLLGRGISLADLFRTRIEGGPPCFMFRAG